MSACDNELFLEEAADFAITAFQPVSDVIIEAQNNGLVPLELKNFVMSVWLVIDQPLKEFITYNSSFATRNLVWAPTLPILREQVCFRQDDINESNRKAAKKNKYDNRDTRDHYAKAEEFEWEEQGNSCLNQHTTQKNISPGLIVYSCSHKVILGKVLS